MVVVGVVEEGGVLLVGGLVDDCHGLQFVAMHAGKHHWQDDAQQDAQHWHKDSGDDKRLLPDGLEVFALDD